MCDQREAYALARKQEAALSDVRGQLAYAVGISQGALFDDLTRIMVAVEDALILICALREPRQDTPQNKPKGAAMALSEACAMLEDIDANGSGLTRWEIGFVDDLLAQVARNVAPSNNQAYQIRKIHRERFVSV